MFDSGRLVVMALMDRPSTLDFYKCALGPGCARWNGQEAPQPVQDASARELAPDWYRDPRSRYAVAVSGRKPRAGESPMAVAGAVEDVREPMDLRRRLVFAWRFALGSLAGLVFVPVGAILSLRRRR